MCRGGRRGPHSLYLPRLMSTSYQGCGQYIEEIKMKIKVFFLTRSSYSSPKKQFENEQRYRGGGGQSQHTSSWAVAPCSVLYPR